jgi:DnaJ like chaperone protein
MHWKMIRDALGLAEGGAVRGAFETTLAALGLERWTDRTPVRKRVAFTIAFVALAAKLSKADGVSVAVESAAFDRIYQVPDGERENVRRLFDLARQDVAGFEAYAARIGGYLDEDPALLHDVFECLFHVALADGVLHRAEEEFLRTVAAEFGVDDDEFETIRSYYVSDPSSPYTVLGLRPDATDTEIKARHRQLVLDNHPDKLIARGVPKEFLAIANRKMASINAAFEEIEKVRRRPVLVDGR